MSRQISHYEVRYIDSAGRIVAVDTYSDVDAARRAEHVGRHAEPATSGWTVYANGAEVRGVLGAGGRPAVGPMLSLRFPPYLLDQLDAHAQRVGTTRSDLIRRGAELLLERDYAMITATAALNHKPAVGDRVGLIRRIQVSPDGTAEDWRIVPESQASHGPLGPEWGDPAGYSIQETGWGTGLVRDIYPHRDLPTYVVEPDA